MADNRNYKLFGPRIGNYMGKPIYESFENQDGTYVFDRIANYADDGYPLDQLLEDEYLFEPGLIYKHTG